MAEDSSANETKETAAADGEDQAAVTTIQLAPEPQLQDAEELMDRLNDLEEEGAIVIDATEVETMTTPIVLTLVSAIRSRAEAEAKPLAVLSPPSTFVDAFTELGLFQDLMKMEFRT